MRRHVATAAVLAGAWVCLSWARSAEAGPPRAAGATEVIGELVNKARTERPRERLEALDAIGATRDPRLIREFRLVELIVDLVGDENPRVARKAAAILGDFVMGVDRSIKEQVRGPLVKVLQNAERPVLVRREAAKQLGRILGAGVYEDAEAMNALIKSASPGPSTPPEVAADALRSLGKIGDPKGREALRAGLSSTDPVVREAALDGLVEALAGPKASEFIDPSLGAKLLQLVGMPEAEGEWREKVIAVIGLAMKSGAKIEADQTFLRILSEEQKPSAVVAALKATSRAASVQAAAALPKVYERFLPQKEGEDAGAEVRAQACGSCGEILEVWTKKADFGVVSRSAEALLELLTRAVLEDRSDSVRKEAIFALGNAYDRRYDRRKAVASLIAILLGNSSDDLKSAARESLEVLTGRSFTEPSQWESWFKANENKLRASGR